MYSHNGEDDRLLHWFSGYNSGFYVDVGAYAPVVASNTYALYKKGWHGIAVDPFFFAAPDLIKQWERERPMDELVHGMASDNDGLHPFYVSDHKEMSTGAIEQWRGQDGVSIGEPTTMVPCFALSTVLYDRAEVIHVLSVDVEGMEDKVLAGLQLSRHRPWIMIVETARSSDLRHYIESFGYLYMLNDGSNDWYVEQEHKGILPWEL